MYVMLPLRFSPVLCERPVADAVLFFYHVDFAVVNLIYHFEINPFATLFVQQRHINILTLVTHF